MQNRDEQIDKLQTLLNRAYDSHNGYSEAADSVDNRSLKLFLFNVSLERKDMIQVLSDQIRSLGGEPNDSGSIKGALHRTWLNVKSALSSDTEESVLEECLRGERTFIEDYMEVLQENVLPREVQNVLSRQLGLVQERVKKLESLETEVA
ncbi:MAG: PA2169 family four-helix-bundle protein [Flavobacteriales bacterium]|nr:PA2169 family four-helix-bundle protein [Flavobacteriales bacterium]